MRRETGVHDRLLAWLAWRAPDDDASDAAALSPHMNTRRQLVPKCVGDAADSDVHNSRCVRLADRARLLRRGRRGGPGFETMALKDVDHLGPPPPSRLRDAYTAGVGRDVSDGDLSASFPALASWVRGLGARLAPGASRCVTTGLTGVRPLVRPLLSALSSVCLGLFFLPNPGPCNPQWPATSVVGCPGPTPVDAPE